MSKSYQNIDVDGNIDNCDLPLPLSDRDVSPPPCHLSNNLSRDKASWSLKFPKVSIPLSVPDYKARKESSKEFRSIDINKDNLVCREEIRQYVESNAGLWAMLCVNLHQLTERDCHRIATHVVMELASGLTGAVAQEAELSQQQFHQFKKKYINDPKGSLEFFHRTVFAAFDQDGNAELDAAELDKFLDIFYEAGSIFRGDARLPEKNALRRVIYEKLDLNGDGSFSFEEIRSLISGSATRGDLIG